MSLLAFKSFIHVVYLIIGPNGPNMFLNYSFVFLNPYCSSWDQIHEHLIDKYECVYTICMYVTQHASKTDVAQRAA